MNILWFSWKDITHPEAGGAEAVTHELLKRAVDDGHKVIMVTSRPSESEECAIIDGYSVYRAGNRWTVYWLAWRRYKQQLSNWPDIVIDECNTIPFFACLYVRQRKLMFFHQLCREIWFYQMPKPVSWVGYILEPIYLRILKNQRAITVSESTAEDLKRFGFVKENISVISEGIPIDPLTSLESAQKYSTPTLLCLGSIRPMKRTMDVVQAYELAKDRCPELSLVIAGSDSGYYAERVRAACKSSRYWESIELRGIIDLETKIELMQKCKLVVVTSVKEGWCLVVTEANSQGTPAIAYNVDGLRDSIQNNQTGWLCEETPEAMADKIVAVLNQCDAYSRVRHSAWMWSKTITFQRAYQDFMGCIRK